jgi:hypothetical protein
MRFLHSTFWIFSLCWHIWESLQISDTGLISVDVSHWFQSDISLQSTCPIGSIPIFHFIQRTSLVSRNISLQWTCPVSLIVIFHLNRHISLVSNNHFTLKYVCRLLLTKYLLSFSFVFKYISSFKRYKNKFVNDMFAFWTYICKVWNIMHNAYLSIGHREPMKICDP